MKDKKFNDLHDVIVADDLDSDRVVPLLIRAANHVAEHAYKFIIYLVWENVRNFKHCRKIDENVLIKNFAAEIWKSRELPVIFSSVWAF